LTSVPEDTATHARECGTPIRKIACAFRSCILFWSYRIYLHWQRSNWISPSTVHIKTPRVSDTKIPRQIF